MVKYKNEILTNLEYYISPDIELVKELLVSENVELIGYMLIPSIELQRADS